MMPTDTSLKEQAVLNRVYNDTSKTLDVSIPGGITATTSTGYYAQKVVVSGSITYVARAAVGSSQSSAVWQAFKVDETSGTVITWADGDSSFNNVATDLTSLNYS